MADVRLIDVNAAIERAKESDKIVDSSIWETCEVVEFLEDCPIEDAAPVVHGRWIEHSHLEVGGECSVCGWQFQWFENGEAHYCPHCGAKMDLEVKNYG